MTTSSPRPGRAAVHRPVDAVARAIRRAPALTAAVAVLITLALAVVGQDAQVATGSDGMAPDNPQVDAATVLAERFGGDAEEVVQVLVTAETGSLISPTGLQTASAIDTAVRASDAAGLLADTPERPAVLTWLFPIQLAQDRPPDAGGDDEAAVSAAYRAAAAELPPDLAGLASGLLADTTRSTEGTDAIVADTALALVFLDPASLPQDETARQEVLMAAQVSLDDHLRAAALPDGVAAEAYSPYLLFAGGAEFDAELGRLFGGAFAVILLILGFVYWVRPAAGLRRARSGRRAGADIVLTLGAIVMAILWMQGIAVLLGPGRLGLIGPMSQFAQVIPVLLIGLGVDYAIHLTSRYREEVGAGATVADGITGAIGTVGAALLLATVATAVGFLTNLLNPIPDLQDFGVLAAVGISSAFLLMLTFVPAVRLLLDRRAERAGRLPTDALGQTSQRLLPDLMARTAVLARRLPVPTLVTALILAGLGGLGLTQLEVRFSNTDQVPQDSPVLTTLETITERFGGGFGETTEVLITGDIATPAVHNSLVAAHEDLADVDDVVQLGGQPAAESIVTVLAQVLATDPTDPDVATAHAAAAAANVGPDLTVAEDADVTDLYDALANAAPDGAAAHLAADADGHGLSRVSLQTSAGEEGGAELSAALDLAFAPVTATGATAVATSGPIIIDVIVQAMRDSQVTSLAITLLVVMLLLVAVFAHEQRRPALGVITVAPVVLVVLWTFGMMALTGIPFGPITATIAALAIGIGLPYAIHVTSRFVEDRRRLTDAGAAITSTVRHTGGAMAGSAFTTMAGFGILTTSSLLPFRQLGLVTVYAVGFSLLAATLVQPSLLVLWDRWHAGRDPQADDPMAPRPVTADRTAASPARADAQIPAVR